MAERYIEPDAMTGQAIVDAIDFVRANGDQLYLRPGLYTVNETMQLPGLGGMVIEGCAQANLDGFANGCGVTLKWVGPAGQPMIRLNGQHTIFRQMTLDGGGTAGAGIVIYSPPGWGSAWTKFEDVTYANIAGPCIQAGEVEGEPNSADASIVHCRFTDSETAFRCVHSQGVNFDFLCCDFQRLGTALDMPLGGAVRVHGGGGGYIDTFLRTGTGGHNCGPISIRDIRFEYAGKTVKYPTFVDAPFSDGGTKVILDGVSFADGSQTGTDNADPVLKIGGNVYCHARDCSFKFAPGRLAVVNGTAQVKARLRLSNCSENGYPLKASAVKANSYASVTGVTTL
jgi:hypothetical protein